MSYYIPCPITADEVAGGDAVPFARLAKELPPGNTGRPVNPATIWRWACEGLRLPDGSRVYLGVARLGRRYLTSRAAWRRFLAAQNAAPEPAAAPQPRPRRDDPAAVGAALEAHGI